MVSKLLLILLTLAAAHGKVVRYTLTVSYISGAPDGVRVNHILGINGKFPGPVIEAEAGDTLEIKVLNRIQDGQNVTLHWHGIHQRGTPFEDGPMQVSQCPIKAGSYQIYSFQVPDAGTFWYHSHVNSQYTEGLWGSMIVRSRQEVYARQYDGEIIITLNDWYHTSAHENDHWLASPVSGGSSPYPFSVLLNGVGRYPCSYAITSNRTCINSQEEGVFRVQPGKTYRLRLINTAGLVAFNFTIDGHKLRTIEVDGLDTIMSSASTGDAVLISAGQRYSFLLSTHTNQPPQKRFTIRASVRKDFLPRPAATNINSQPDALPDEVTAVLMYDRMSPMDSNNVVQPRYEKPPRNSGIKKEIDWTSLRFVREDAMIPYDRLRAPTTFNKNVNLRIEFVTGTDGIRRGSFNGVPAWLPTGRPQLASYLSGESVPEAGMPVVINYGDIVQVVVNNPGGFPHPIHLHGHHFWVMGTGEGEYRPGFHRLNFNGVRRDTELVRGGSWLVLRFKADNPGVWSLHCHIDWHMLTGMMMTFVEAPEKRMGLKIPPEARRVCADHGIRF